MSEFRKIDALPCTKDQSALADWEGDGIAYQ